MKVTCRWCQKNKVELTFWTWVFYRTVGTLLWAIVPCNDCYHQVSEAFPPD